MESALFELAVVMLAAWLVWRLIAQRLNLPGRPGASRDDSADVPSRLRPKPTRGAGAVALAEPEEDEPDEPSLNYRGRRLER